MNDIKEKTCRKCGRLKPAEDFYENKYSPDGLYAFCKVCFDQFAEKAKQTPPPAKPTQKPRQSAAPGKKEKKINPAAIKEPKPAKKTPPIVSEDFDYIEYLIENQALKKKLEREILQIPKQMIKIKARKRICNGCRKTEEIDQVEKNTVIPAHAWFCDICQQRTNKRWVRKGTIVCDYWGREFKVKKIISRDLVLGVLKDKNGKWETKSQKIYGDWKIPQHSQAPRD